MTKLQEEALLEVYPTPEERENDSTTYTYMVSDSSSPDDLITRIQQGAYIASLQ